MKKLIISLMVIMAFALQSSAQTSGKCGPNVRWIYSPETNTLTISGTGDMYSYDDERDWSPWSEYNDRIKKVIINKGVTDIGDFAFVECNGLTSISIPNSVTYIGHFAFSGCSRLKSITIPNSVTKIGSCAFGDDVRIIRRSSAQTRTSASRGRQTSGKRPASRRR